MKKPSFIFLFLLSPIVVEADVTSFECEVTNAYAVNENGEMITDTDHLKEQIGSTFSVERETGEIRGGYYINNSNSESISVINEPTDNSYYVLFESYDPYKSVGYLYIANQREWPSKPFTFTSNGEYVYVGTCI